MSDFDPCPRCGRPHNPRVACPDGAYPTSDIPYMRLGYHDPNPWSGVMFVVVVSALTTVLVTLGRLC